MPTPEPQDVSINTQQGDKPSNAGAARNQEEFERRLSQAAKRSFWRTAISVAALVAAGLAILVYSVQRARQQAEEALQQANQSELQTKHFQFQLHELEQSLSNSREAVQYVTQGINLYHAGSYSAAVNAYDAALQLDPENPYTLDLKGYSLFKLKDYAGASSAMQNSVAIQPDYAWGYFDLARVYCAEGKYDLASTSIKSALEIRPELAGSMKNDGEFLRVCTPLRKMFDDGSSSAPATLAPQSSSGTQSHAQKLKSERESTTSARDNIRNYRSPRKLKLGQGNILIGR